MSDDQLPVIDFATFVMSVVHSAWMHLGQVPHHDSQNLEIDLPMAKQSIDLVGLLEEKTKGNLSGDEERLIHQVLYELRSKYVELTKADSSGTPA